MMLWEKKSLFDSFKKVVFNESLGYGVMPKFNPNELSFIIDKKPHQIKDLFVKVDDKFIPASLQVEQLFDNLSSESLYICTSFIEKKFEKAKIASVSYDTMVRVIKTAKDLELKTGELDLKAFSLNLPIKEFLGFTLWVNEGSMKNAMLRPGYHEVGFDEEFYLFGEGEVKVIKTYQPDNEKGFLCDVLTNDEKTKQIQFNEPNFITTPEKYNEIYEVVLSKFTPGKNENSFRLHVENKTMFYQPVAHSEKYVVVLSKLVRDKFGFQYYHLKDYELSKDTHCFYVPEEDNLHFGANLYVKLIALDKLGAELASTGVIEF